MSRTGSFLYVSQSTVSKRIANLEKKIGKKLIEPDGRYIRLTADAVALVETIEPTFRELCGQIYESQALEHHTLIRLDCSETLVAGLISEALADCVQQDRYITITTNHTPRIVENVKSGRAAIGISAGYLPPHHGLLAFHVVDEPFFIVSRQPLQALPDVLITNDLSNNANTYQAAILDRLNICPVMEIDSYTAAAQLALKGAAPALTPLSIVKALQISADNYFMFDELRPLFRPIHISVRQNNYRQPRIKAIIENMMAAIAETNADN